jgi:ketosteroid isomerase-like protein
MGFFEKLGEAWETNAFEPTSFIDAGDRVVVRCSGEAHSRGASRAWSSAASTPCARGGSFTPRSSGIKQKPSKLAGCRSRTHAPSPPDSHQAILPGVMSRENVDLVRRVFRAFNERDVDVWLASHTTDVEWRLIGGFADLMGTEFKGHEGLRRFFNDWVGNLGVTGEMEAVFEVDDRVVVIVRGVAAGPRAVRPRQSDPGRSTPSAKG